MGRINFTQRCFWEEQDQGQGRVTQRPPRSLRKNQEDQVRVTQSHKVHKEEQEQILVKGKIKGKGGEGDG
jgi:hypothetical protein